MEPDFTNRGPWGALVLLLVVPVLPLTLVFLLLLLLPFGVVVLRAFLEVKLEEKNDKIT